MKIKFMVLYAQLFPNLSFTNRPENICHLCPIKTKINFYFVKLDINNTILLISNFTKSNLFLSK